MSNKNLLDFINNGGRFDFDNITLIDSFKDKVFVSNLTVNRKSPNRISAVEHNHTVIYNRKDINKIDNINSKYVIFTDNDLIKELREQKRSGEMPYTKKSKLQDYTLPIIKEFGVFSNTVFIPLERIYTKIKNLYVDTSQQKPINQYPNLVEMAVNLGLDRYLTNHEYNRSLLMPLVVKTLYYIDVLIVSTDITSFTNWMDEPKNVKKKNNKFYVTKEGIIPIKIDDYETDLTPNREVGSSTKHYTFCDIAISWTKPIGRNYYLTDEVLETMEFKYVGFDEYDINGPSHGLILSYISGTSEESVSFVRSIGKHYFEKFVIYNGLPVSTNINPLRAIMSDGLVANTVKAVYVREESDWILADSRYVIAHPGIEEWIKDKCEEYFFELDKNNIILNTDFNEDLIGGLFNFL